MNQQPSESQNINDQISSGKIKTTNALIYFVVLSLILIIARTLFMEVYVLFFVLGIIGLIPTIIILVLTGKNRSSKFALYSSYTGLVIMLASLYSFLNANFINPFPDDTSSGIINFLVHIATIASFSYGFILSFCYDDSRTKFLRYSSIGLLVIGLLLVFFAIVK